MSAALDRLRSLFPPVVLSGDAGQAGDSSPWSWVRLAGRLCELSGADAPAVLTLAMGLVWEAQREGEPVAWIAGPVSGPRGGFYPLDAAANGVDLEALAVVRVPDALAAARAASRLARSGAFGLIVLDLGPNARIPIALQGRLAQQALRHDAAIVCLTEKPARAAIDPQDGGLGPMISLRGQATRLRLSLHREGGNRFSCTLTVSKDKRKGPGWTHDEVCHGPPGLR